MLRADLRFRRDGFELVAAFQAPLPGVTALFGASGCGKTTVVNLLAGLLRPDEGRIELEGRALTDVAQGIAVPPEDRAIGYVFQEGRLFPHLSVDANLRYGLKRQGRRPHAGLAADFDQVVALLGLEDLLGRRPHRLSGGERQRVALGRALLARPKLLLLDEPLASLDVARREEVLPYLERLRDELHVPMVLVSHQFDEVLRLATHMVVMERGRTVAAGSVTSVATSAALRAIVGTEAVGAVLDGVVEAVDPGTRVSRVRVANSVFSLAGTAHAVGHPLRVQVLARDVILALSPPAGLSVRNALPARIVAITPEAAGTELVELDAGSARLLCRITAWARQELQLEPGQAVWALVKAASIRTAAGA